MKTTVPLLCLVIGVGPAMGQERLPQKEATRYAKACISQVATNTKVVPEKAIAVLGEGGGAMVIPVQNLPAKLQLDTKVRPVGQLWLRKWTLVVDGKPIPDRKLRIVKPILDDKERPMPLLLLGVRTKKGQPQLAIYSKGTKPLQILPLKKTDFVQQSPLEIEWQRGENNIDKLPLTIRGKYWADVRVTRR